MKLFVNRDISACDVCFEIYDELGREKYKANERRTKPAVQKKTAKLDITDKNKAVCARIRQLPIVGVSSFSLKAPKKSATLVIMKAHAGVSCRFYGNNWHIVGDIASKEFSIIDVDNAVIASQSKKNSGFVLEITDSENELICLAASLCINMINTVDKPALQTV